MKTSLVPSGDHFCSKSAAGWSVSWVGPLPSAFMTQISPVPPRLDRNAIFLPSGDHAGSVSDAGWAVRFVTPVPSGFIA